MHFSRLIAIFLLFSGIYAVTSAHAVRVGTKESSHSKSESYKASLDTSSNRVVVIPVEGEVDYGLFAFLKRATAEALLKKPNVVIYKVNTYGGELHSAFEIVDLIVSVKSARTYVYVEQKAISAGALIALACNRMAMGDGTTIGDCAPISQSAEGGIVMLGEKIQSPLRAKFRNLAERNGYPSLLSQAMVTADIGVVAAFTGDTARAGSSVPDYFTIAEWEALSDARKSGYRDHKVVVRAGELLTMTDREAMRHGFSQGSFHTFDAFLKHNRFTVIATLATTWSEDLARMLGKAAPFLMLLGFGALYLEFKTPGLSVFGAAGVLCLGIAFGSKYAVGLANHTELLLLLGGIALFAIEIYVLPGTFIAGFLGLVLMLAALTLSLQGFTVPNPQMPWEMNSLVDNFALTLGMAALALLIPLLAVRFVLPHLPRKASVVSSVTMADALGASADILPLQIGQTGVTPTGLRPSGKAFFDGVSYEVSSRGEFIEAGSAVEIVRLHGRTVVVQTLENAA
jgi:membrane-bound serine protease (ClpP class)